MKFKIIIIFIILITSSCLSSVNMFNYSNKQSNSVNSSYIANNFKSKKGAANIYNQDYSQSCIKEFYVANEGDYCYLTIKLNRIGEYNTNVIENPDRFYIDFVNTIIEPPKQSVNINEGLIKQIRTGKFNSNTSRIVLDIFEPFVFSMNSDGELLAFMIDIDWRCLNLLGSFSCFIGL